MNSSHPKCDNDSHMISISIVSHGQLNLVKMLFDDLEKYCSANNEIILTLNVEEELSFDINSYPFQVHIIRNVRPKGFSENHNTAFAMSSNKYFCVLNPDIRLTNNPFPALVTYLENENAGVVAPQVVNLNGELENSVRSFPTPFSIIKKLIIYNRRNNVENVIDHNNYWVAGMFMLFKNSVFKNIKGFDERYFLYYEDVDICARLRLAGYRIVYSPEVTVTHDAQRTSHGNLRYLRWHLSSMARYFTSKVFIKTLFSNR